MAEKCLDEKNLNLAVDVYHAWDLRLQSGSEIYRVEEPRLDFPPPKGPRSVKSLDMPVAKFFQLRKHQYFSNEAKYPYELQYRESLRCQSSFSAISQLEQSIWKKLLNS